MVFGLDKPSRSPILASWRDQRGIAIVEWALIAPFLFALMLGVIDLSVVGYHKMQMANAVRAGVQYATVRKPVQGDTTGIENAIDTAAPADESGTRQTTVSFFCQCPNGTAVNCDDACGTGDREAYVGIVIQEQHDLMLGLSFLTDSLTLRSEGMVRLN